MVIMLTLHTIEYIIIATCTVLSGGPEALTNVEAEGKGERGIICQSSDMLLQEKDARKW